MVGTIFDIQHFCVDDGPGIRTTVFFKGCPLRCIWCHNPEGYIKQPQMVFNVEKCVGCGRCTAVCRNNGHELNEDQHLYHRENCTLCGECVKVCRLDVLRIQGREIRVEEVIEEVIQDIPFYETSGGGLTLSGGEPFFQGSFAIELLKKAKAEKLHTCVETSGFCKEEVILEASDYTDLFLLDIKETDPERHKEYTGVYNEQILRNAHLLAKRKKEIILRCPVVPDCNDRTEHFQKIGELANTLKSVTEIHLEPYHPLGLGKYRQLGLEAVYRNEEFLENKIIEDYAGIVRNYTKIPVKVS